MSKLVEIELPENLTVANIHPIHERLEAAVEDKDHNAICINASSVLRADTAGVQLLFAFVNAAKDRDISLVWNSPSEKLCAAITILGMRESLGLA